MTENNDIKQLIIEGIQERKGRDITIVDMDKVDGATIDRFIICQGNSSMQVTAIDRFIICQGNSSMQIGRAHV